MEDLFRHFWWLMFPLFWLVFAGMRLWMSYQHQQAWLEIVRTYAARGEAPPPEMATIARAAPVDPFRPRDRPWRRGPLGEWRRVILFTALSGGFFMASFVTDSGEASQDFQVVAVIMAVLAGGFCVMAILSTVMARTPHSDEP